MSRITPFLYLGNANDAQNNLFLKKSKVKLIINCAKELPNYFPDQFEYIRLNWDDYPEQNISPAVAQVTQKIISEIKNKNVVFVHCAAGISRSVTVVIYVIMHLHNWNLEKSLNYVKILREIIHPNPGFIHQLKDLANGGNSQHRSLPHPSVEHSYNENNKNNEDREEYSSIDTELRGEPTKEKDIPLYKEPTNKDGWSSLTFDSDRGEQPEFIKNKKRMYARIL